MPTRQELIKKIFPKSQDKLTPRERDVVDHLVDGKHISRNTNKEFDESTTFGQKVADNVAWFGGSWTFIIAFLVTLLVWIGINSYLLSKTEAFDPYPYILLNLVLSMLAAIQAPIILMSQNRQAFKDRLQAGHDFEVNLKAELEIRILDNKLDRLLTEHQELRDMIAKMCAKGEGTSIGSN